ncbi:hypothetical protein SeMB42_g03511 [Synchytrium endobioticum]|uniref:Phosphatidylinositol 3,4,5-trisphosphate 3-phosphatase and dual-specificity protein phosphatase PTEN n=1 Tax=Synchytrium endobioticum TaxID=286115 RepID=A0A507D058_9FUNG|nr:hypothetical protein SeLEV6574_g04281 [Synchytrium endobioticum]TPX46992.1 hypothetical protein SeMB42_g03511 [Synchytrium endobioticum]
MSLFNALRIAVSLAKRRYVDDSFNLDLTYICDNVIAMGAPAEKMDALYRNPINEVRRFLDLKHPKRYRIYNLCSERCYPSSRFPSAHIAHYPFDDHNPPSVEMFEPFVQDVIKWLSLHEKNVAVVHCKAGKGRTGVMVCAYLMASGLAHGAEEAIRFYAIARTKNQQGVTIPSQVRYIHYCDSLIQNGWKYTPRSLFMQSMAVSSTYSPLFDPIIIITIHNTIVYASNASTVLSQTNNEIRITPGSLVPLCGDIKVECFQRNNTVKMFQFWFNTAFLHSSEPGVYKLVLPKCEVDGAHKDRHHKKFDAGFRIEMELLDLISPPPAKDVVAEANIVVQQRSSLSRHQSVTISPSNSRYVSPKSNTIPLINRDAWQASQSRLSYLADSVMESSCNSSRPRSASLGLLGDLLSASLRDTGANVVELKNLVTGEDGTSSKPQLAPIEEINAAKAEFDQQLSEADTDSYSIMN